jgi:hypothetical protein
MEKSWFSEQPYPRRRNMNYIRSHFAALFLASLFTLPSAAQAQFEFVTNNGTITITRYTGPGGDVTIPSTINGLPVTCIGWRAFHICTSLTSVTIPNTVTSIAYEAFSLCTNLTSVAIPDSVTSIGSNAFFTCVRLTDIILGKNVSSIGGWAFYSCASLTDIMIPKSVVSIGPSAFEFCTMLAGVYFLGNAPSVSRSHVFYNDTNQNIPTVYYLPWTAGWEEAYGGRPTEVWNPVEWLAALAGESQVRNQKPLMASLSAAQKSIDRGNRVAAANQLRAFQNKVQAQVSDTVLARQFIEAAQQVIEAL